jgi:NDP-sugar pyrophosphorylase family protein
VDALILAAGLGSRLGEVGRDTPKALLDVGGRTMLEHAASRLAAAGVDRLIINAHHHADRIEEFLQSHDLGLETILSLEKDEPLETGGAVVHARHHFRGNSPFFIQNVDVLTDPDYRALLRAHREGGALVTLAVSGRSTPRKLLFDRDGLYGWANESTGKGTEVRAPREPVERWPFAGIHVASPELLERITEEGVFSILDPYFRLAREGVAIRPASIGDALWMEVRTPERLAAARTFLEAQEEKGA